MSDIHSTTLNIHFTTTNIVRQIFSLPKFIMDFICFEPNISPKLFYKLYFCCKFFYSKIKIIPVHGAYMEKSMLKLTSDKKESVKLPQNSIKTLNFKFFVSKFVASNNLGLPESFGNFLTKLWKCNITILSIGYCELTLNEYKMLTANIRHLQMNITVRKENGMIAACEELLAYVPNCYHFDFCSETQYGYTKKTAENIALLDRNAKINGSMLLDVPETFNAAAFMDFVKKNANKSSYFHVVFAENVEESYKTKFKKILEKHEFPGKTVDFYVG